MKILIHNPFVMTILQDQKYTSRRNKGLTRIEGMGVTHLPIIEQYEPFLNFSLSDLQSEALLLMCTVSIPPAGNKAGPPDDLFP
jgi:hypothetical protein